MTQLILSVPDDRSLDGPAMSALTDQQRAFVYAMVESGVNDKNANRCALAAGYSGENPGYRIMRNDRILAALHEQAKKRLVGAALLGVNVVMEIANSPTHKDRFRAAKELMAINGFTAEQKITVTHVRQEEADVVQKIKDTGEKLGLNAMQIAGLLEKAGVIDAEFTVVVPGGAAADVDDSDW